MGRIYQTVTLYKPFNRGTKRFKALIDTGADQSLISPELAHELGLIDSGFRVTIESVNGTVDTVPEMNVSLKVSGVKVGANCAVMKTRHGLLIGHDVLQRIPADKVRIVGERLVISGNVGFHA